MSSMVTNGIMWPVLVDNPDSLSQELLGNPYQLPNLMLQSQDLQSPPLQLVDEGGTLHAGGGAVVLPEWLDDESTVDVAQAEEVLLQPVNPRGPPARQNYSGPYAFELMIDSNDCNKKKYLYSAKLNRIYVDMGAGFSVQFKWDWDAAAKPLLVRATTVFSDESQAEKRVERCLQHVHPSNNVSSTDARYHVLQSTRAPGIPGVFYCGASAEPLSWYSVAVEFPARPDAGALRFSHAYAFQCKNTCNSGINRRAIEIVFTLEDIFGREYGRQVVGARVCSCPRRDLKKDEQAAPLPPDKRRRATPAAPAAGKRVKLEAPDDAGDDDGIYPLCLDLQFEGRRRSENFLNNTLTHLVAGQAETNSEPMFKLYAKQIEQVKLRLAQLRDGQ